MTMNKQLIRLADWMARGARVIALAGMVIMTPVVFVNVVLRYLFGYSVAWSSEVARYSFVWITFMGTAVALWEGSHAKIDYFVERFPPRLRRIIMVIANLVIALLCLLLIIAGTKQVIDIWPTKAAYMRFMSMGGIYVSIPLMGLLGLVFVSVKILEILNCKDRGAEF
jgi:C4-dicarboxylate transporter DctQ subunit